MTKTTRKTSRKSNQEFKTWLKQFVKKYDSTIKELAKGPYRIASDKEIKSKLAGLDKRYNGLYDDLAKT